MHGEGYCSWVCVSVLSHISPIEQINFAGVVHNLMFHPGKIKTQRNAHINAEGLDLRLIVLHYTLFCNNSWIIVDYYNNYK